MEAGLWASCQEYWDGLRRMLPRGICRSKLPQNEQRVESQVAPRGLCVPSALRACVGLCLCSQDKNPESMNTSKVQVRKIARPVCWALLEGWICLGSWVVSITASYWLRP